MHISDELRQIKIAGFSKLTLLDFPEKMAAILFLAGCNMNCPYCHNHQLNAPHAATVPVSDVLDFLHKRRKVLDGVVITGGEPTLQEIEPLLRKIKEMGYLIKLDTNGLKPGTLQRLIETGLLDYIAMDVKNSAPMMSATAGIPPSKIRNVQESINKIMKSGITYEFRTTVTPSLHDTEQIAEIGRTLIYEADNYYLQPFVMSDAVPQKHLKEPSDKMLKECLDAVAPYVKHAEIRGREI